MIIFYDGECGLCHGFVRFICKRSHAFHFAPLQGKNAAKLLPEAYRHDLSTVVFYQEGDLLTRYQAILAIIPQLGGFWSVVAKLLKIIPTPLGDALYHIIATYRHHLWKKRDLCELPSPAKRHLFLD